MDATTCSGYTPGVRGLADVFPAQPLEALSSELARSRLECLELRIALSSLCEAVESWGQWTMSKDLAAAQHRATALLSAKRAGSTGT
jgi:hypothetical protein